MTLKSILKLKTMHDLLMSYNVYLLALLISEKLSPLAESFNRTQNGIKRTYVTSEQKQFP